MTDVESNSGEYVSEDFSKYQETDPKHPSTTGPVGFVRDILGIPAEGFDPFPGVDQPYLWKHQQAVLLGVEEFQRTSVAACHAVGKDWTASIVVAWFFTCFPGSIVVTTGPTDRQVRLLLWGEIKQKYGVAKLRGHQLPGTLLTTEWKVADLHYAIGFKSKDENPERFAGFHAPHLLYVVDEASGVEDAMFIAMEGGMSAGDARMLLIGNPLQQGGYFHRTFTANRKNWHTVQVGFEDTPNYLGRNVDGSWTVGPSRAKYFIQSSWAEEKRIEWGETSPLYVARVKGQFPDVGTDTLISLAWVMKAVNSTHDPRMRPGPLSIGVDCARYGDDETVLVSRRGVKFEHMEAWNTQDTMTSAYRIRDYILSTGESSGACRVDVIGIGSGIFDRLVEFQTVGQLPPGWRLIPVNVGLRPTDAAKDHPSEKYQLLRDELWWELREKFRLELVTDMPEDDILLGQLTTIKYSLKANRIMIEKKEDMKKRGLDSPDRAEAVMLAFVDYETPMPMDDGILGDLDIGDEFQYSAGIREKEF